MTRVFPSILIVLDLCAAVAYCVAHDWRHVIYWLSAAVLTASVTF